MANDRDDNDPIEEDESFPRRGEGAGVSETLRKLLTAGVSAAFMTEEHIRGFVSELKLPKETLNLLLQGASKSKEELMNRVSNEAIKMIRKIDLVKEASRFAEEHKFKITAEIEVMRKEPASKDLAKSDQLNEDIESDK